MKKIFLVLAVCIALFSTACAQTITLYGESEHGNESVLMQEADLWHQAYHEQGLRHLFVELPYYTAEYLNLWMQAEDDFILDQVYEDWQGTASYTQAVKHFYQRIKAECPETVFHGTDVGHQYHTTGQRFLDMLQANGQEKSEAYRLAQEAVKQGMRYYASNDSAYRENAMVQNFRAAYDRLNGESMVGIYGSAHTGLNALAFDGSVPCMAAQLRAHYGEIITSETIKAKVEPICSEMIELGGKAYTAQYFGAQNLKGIFEGYDYREFWRLENAYEDLKTLPKTGDVLPENNYPMPVENGQVFIIDYHMLDGTVNRMYYRCDGNLFGNGLLATEQFTYHSEP